MTRAFGWRYSKILGLVEVEVVVVAESKARLGLNEMGLVWCGG